MRLPFITLKFVLDGSFFKKARATAPRLQDKLDFENNSKIYIPTDYT